MDCDEKYYDAYNQWLANCTHICHDYVEKVRKKRLDAAAVAIALCLKKQKRPSKIIGSTVVRSNVKPVCKVKLINLSDKVLEDLSFHDYIRMSTTQFEELLTLVAPAILKLKCIGDAINVAEALLLTLKFVASGDSIHSVSCQYKINTRLAEDLIFQTCTAIWNKLVEAVLPSKLNKAKWLEIAQDFEEKCNFPHCIGAIDAMHVMLQPPSDKNSSDQNLNEITSFVLLVICDANFMFTFVDMGTYGRRSRGEIFRESYIGTALEKEDLNIPPPSPLANNDDDTIKFPYCLVGDEAFPPKTYLLRPYPQSDCLEVSRLNFNCRLIRAQRTIEASMGILSSRWKIFGKSINLTAENTMKVVQACVCLHNWLRLGDLKGNNSIEYLTPELVDQKVGDIFISGSCKKNQNHSTAFKEIRRTGSNLGTRCAIETRDQFLAYFNNDEMA